MGMRYIYEVGATLWLTHTRDLVYQTRDRALSTLKGVGRVGILGDGIEDFGDRKLIIATVQTLKAKQRLVEKLKEFIGVVVNRRSTPLPQYPVFRYRRPVSGEAYYRTYGHTEA